MSPDHHGSHRKLLSSRTAPARTGRIDAIVIPTARPPAFLDHAADLARRLGCPVVALCSGPRTGAATVRRRLPWVIAADFPGPEQLRLPGFATSRVLPHSFQRSGDLAAKRNAGLLLARMMGWRNLAFLDDDIVVSSPGDLCSAAALLDEHGAVALSVSGYPDNSVVCHAYRDVGGDQDTFVGSGALVVDTAQARSFFPDVYNEDWFFVLEVPRLGVTGQMWQAPYDPYESPERARDEEFGDVLAEGIFWLLDDRRPVSEANLEHWRTFLRRRRSFIEHIHARLHQADAAKRAPMEESLRAALGRLARITPELCVRYLDAWREDLRVWHDHLRDLRPAGSVEEALGSLGVTSLVTNLSTRVTSR
ncbi:hypothetical protein ACIBKY_10420 [Nonomuraea sp. NPDC050394]|uniref:hypothetical protein n=1 Tax=Nonomuraea sp. NPDC050394 TaxID=3364363 RepID=UPI0037A05539